MKKLTDKKYLTIFLMIVFILASTINISKVNAEAASSSAQTTTCTSYVALGDSKVIIANINTFTSINFHKKLQLEYGYMG